MLSLSPLRCHALFPSLFGSLFLSLSDSLVHILCLLRFRLGVEGSLSLSLSLSSPFQPNPSLSAYHGAVD